MSASAERPKWWKYVYYGAYVAIGIFGLYELILITKKSKESEAGHETV